MAQVRLTCPGKYIYIYIFIYLFIHLFNVIYMYTLSKSFESFKKPWKTRLVNLEIPSNDRPGRVGHSDCNLADFDPVRRDPTAAGLAGQAFNSSPELLPEPHI